MERKQRSKEKGNGEGTLYKSSKTGLYVAQYFYNGSRKTIYQKKNEKITDFKNRFNKILMDINQNTYIEKSSKTLGELIEEILNYKFNTNKIGERTYRRTQDTINLIKRSETNIYTTPMQKITKKQLKNFLISITIYSNSTIDKIYQLIHKAFNKAIVQKIISDDFFLDEDEIYKPKSDKANIIKEALTVAEQKKLIEIIENKEKNNYYNTIILLMMYTGMRIGEVLALNRNTDLDFENKYIHITKTVSRDRENNLLISNKTKTKNSNRNIKMLNIVEKILKQHLNSSLDNVDNLLFYKNGIVVPQNVDTYLFRLNKKYHICKNLSCHIFRHTYATRCIESGMSAKVLQKKLGHANISTTLDTYASVFAKFEDNEDEKYINYSENEGLIINI